MHAHTDLIDAVDTNFERTARRLARLVEIPSISADPDRADDVVASAESTIDLLIEAGFQNVRRLEIDGSHPAVFGEIPAPDGAPTVLLYAHHDVQPVGAGWTVEPFKPSERNGRLYGRGTSDDKCGIVMHVAAVEAHGGRPPVGVKVFVEGEEEIGSAHLADYLAEYGELLASDTIVIADSANWRTGIPTLTTSLRGLVDCVVEVRTLDHAVHSGMYGGLFPDALTTLSRLIASLHDEDGGVAVQGLHSSSGPGLPLTEDEARVAAEARPTVAVLGAGSLTDKVWNQPAVSVLGIDAPPVDGAVNALIPTARAKISMRIPPGQGPDSAMQALADHLEQHVPWGAEVTVTPGSSGEAFALETTGAAYDAFREAFQLAWGSEPVEMGVGGSIPFVAAFSEAYPEASILLIGVADDKSRAHGPDESLDLEELRRGCHAEAIALRLLAR